MGVIKGDTRSLDYGSYQAFDWGQIGGTCSDYNIRTAGLEPLK